MFDEQFNYVPAGSGFIRTGYYEDRRLQTLATNGLPIVKSGYLFVYLSNETKTKPVFFDNLVVRHYTGPLVEENAYYPFGLKMAGISSNAAERLENKYKYNGKEEQRKEFSDGSGLEWLDYSARMYDAQLGRWFNADPLADVTASFSPYVYGNDNPILYIDPTGMVAEHSRDSEAPNWINDKQNSRNENRSGYITDRINIDEKSKRVDIFTNSLPYDEVSYDGGNTVIRKPKGWFNEKAYSDAGYSIWYPYALGTGAFTEAVKTLLGVKLLGWVFGRAGSWLASRLASKLLGKAGTTVLGKTGFYEALAEKLGANKFVTKAGQYTWEANKKFLDDAIARGDKFVLSNSAYLKEAGTKFSDEIDYLLSKGYKVAQDGMSLLK